MITETIIASSNELITEVMSIIAVGITGYVTMMIKKHLDIKNTAIIDTKDNEVYNNILSKKERLLNNAVNYANQEYKIVKVKTDDKVLIGEMILHFKVVK